jgi:hypothetical protein
MEKCTGLSATQRKTMQMANLLQNAVNKNYKLEK